MFSPHSQKPRGAAPLRAALRHAAGLAVAFLTLADETSPHDLPDGDHGHPHRRPLRPPTRARRPGAGPPPPQPCITPLPRRLTARRTPARS